MSRYEISCLKRGYKAAVGYDPPMKTYFGEVYRVRGLRYSSILWLGSIPEEIESVEDLQCLLAGYVQLDEAMVVRLQTDRIEASLRNVAYPNVWRFD